MKSLWKLILVTTLVQMIQCKNYIGKHFLISTKHGTNKHGLSKLDLHTKKYFDKKHGLNKKVGHDYQFSAEGIPSSITPLKSTGKYDIFVNYLSEKNYNIYIY